LPFLVVFRCCLPSLGVATGLVLSSADSLPLDWSLPNESPSDGLSLANHRERLFCVWTLRTFLCCVSIQKQTFTHKHKLNKQFQWNIDITRSKLYEFYAFILHHSYKLGIVLNGCRRPNAYLSLTFSLCVCITAIHPLLPVPVWDASYANASNNKSKTSLRLMQVIQ